MEKNVSAILPATAKDKAIFLTSPHRSVRVRLATKDEKRATGIRFDAEAHALLMSFCGGTVKVIVEPRPLKEDVTKAVSAFVGMAGRRRLEADDAVRHIPLMSVDDLAALAFKMMTSKRCDRCTCAKGYTPLVAGLAEAAAKAEGRPWTGPALNHAFDAIKATAAPAVMARTASPEVTAMANAIRTIIRAAGYAA